MSTTRYVPWSLHTKSRASLKAMLNRVRAWPAPDALVSQFLTGSLHSCYNRDYVKGTMPLCLARCTARHVQG